MRWIDEATEWTPELQALADELSERAKLTLDILYPQKISETPYAMTGIGGSGEIGRLYGIEVWEQNGEPYVHPDTEDEVPE